MVRIDPAVHVQETEALLDWYRTRSLIQAQAIADLRAALAEAEARCQPPASTGSPAPHDGDPR